MKKLMRKILQPSQENTFNKVLVEENVTNPTSIYLFKINNRNNRKMCEICSKLIIKTPERRR